MTIRWRREFRDHRLGRWRDSPGPGQRSAIRDPYRADQLLRRLWADDAMQRELRRLASQDALEGPPGSADALLPRLRSMLMRGELRVHTVWEVPPGPDRHKEEVAPLEARRITSKPNAATPEPASKPAEPDTFPATLDANAVAALMRQAAVDGTPLCEECQQHAMGSASPAGQPSTASEGAPG